MSSKIPKQYLLTDEEILNEVKEMSKEDIWEIDLYDNMEVELYEYESILEEAKAELKHTKGIIAKMVDNGMDVGIPKGMGFDAKELVDIFYSDEMIEKQKAKWEGHELNKGITIDGIIEYVWKMQLVPVFAELITSKFAEHHKAKVTRLQEKLKNAKLVSPSVQKGRKYFTEKDIKVLPYLPKVWDDNLPFNKEGKFLHNQKSWFGMIETETGVGYETIRSIHKKWKNDYKEGKIPEDKLKPLPSSKKK